MSAIVTFGSIFTDNSYYYNIDYDNFPMFYRKCYIYFNMHQLQGKLIEF